jgi:hypothetical protein
VVRGAGVCVGFVGLPKDSEDEQSLCTRSSCRSLSDEDLFASEGVEVRRDVHDQEGQEQREKDEGRAQGHVPDLSHDYWWITRSNRAAKCNACGEKMLPYTFRVAFHPHPSQVDNPDRWQVSWWKYYHLKACCLFANHSQLALMREVDPVRMVQDCVALPRKTLPSQTADEAIGWFQAAFREWRAGLGFSVGSGSSTDRS